jgi:probable HAF family extracellular repeat protein
MPPGHRRGLVGRHDDPRLRSAGRRLHPIAFPLATDTTAFGINDTGEIAGVYTDAAGTLHGFIYAGGAFSTVDVAGARGTQLTRIKNDGLITGVSIDALNGQHGLIGQ